MSENKTEKLCKHWRGSGSWGHCGHPSNAGHIYQERITNCTNAGDDCRGYEPREKEKKGKK